MICFFPGPGCISSRNLGEASAHTKNSGSVNIKAESYAEWYGKMEVF